MSDYLEHHGILGQKWGIRRFQNPDGTLTDSGKQRYLKDGTINPTKILNKNSKNPEDIKRRNAAVRLGLIALANAGYLSWIDDPNDFFDDYESHAEWFNWEDQTVGYTETADLILQGYSKKDLNKTLKLDYDILYSGDYKEFGIADEWEINTFYDQCKKMLNKKSFNPYKKISDQKNEITKIFLNKK